MKQLSKQEKQLLIKDLCARLPYEVKVHIKGEYHKHHRIEGIDVGNETISYFENLHFYEESIHDCKPYLRPMSSMTEEEMLELSNLNSGLVFRKNIIKNIILDVYYKTDAIDWLNAHHFDYRGLIEKGLALEAPEGMYKLKEK